MLLRDHRSIRSAAFTAIVVGMVFTGFARRGAAQGLNDEILELAAEVMSSDYADERYTAARKKLQQALKRCGKQRCAPDVRSVLYRHLGVVYFALRNKRQARDAFEKALDLDPSGRLDRDLATPELSVAFRRAGGEIEEPERQRANTKASESEESESEESESEESESEESESEDSQDQRAETASHEDTAGKDAGSRSFLALNLQQDWLVYDDASSVCGSSEYTCFAEGTEYTGPIWSGYGNRVSGGLALATTRVLLGFDQLLGDNVQLGARLGYAFRGGPATRDGSAFLPAHAELRIAYYFGNQPFQQRGIRPYLALGGGLAEVRSRVDVDFYEDVTAYNRAQKQTLDAWRTTGRTFIAPTIGTQFAFSRSLALSLELRWMVLRGGNGSAPAASIGVVQGL
jgi:tetratricopeptide (TPR) repeat protein